MIYPFVKRGMDVFVALLLVIILAPLLIILWFTVRFVLGSPALFSQVRPGLDGRPFRMIKFRSMNNAVDTSGDPLPDEQRLAPFGRFLRSSSLDELPELWNVLTGEMSMIGPRPLLMEYLPLFSEEQARRHDVRPGITGWAQVNGRNALSWDEKFALDVWYVDHCSFLLDMKILWMTLLRVTRAQGITQQGHASAEKFTGNQS